METGRVARELADDQIVRTTGRGGWRRGGVWTSRVECGDALYHLRRIPEGEVGAIVSDPPFHIGIGRDEGSFGRDPWSTEVQDSKSAVDWSKPFAAEFRRTVRPGGAVVLMAGVHAVAAWMTACEEAGLIWMAELEVLWNAGKPRARNFGSLHTHILWFTVPGARHTWNSDRRAIYSNILVCDKVPQAYKFHPAQKPVALTTFLISLLTKRGDLVVDPFCGSGTTLVSAEVCERPWLGIDRERHYADIARRRAAMAEVEEDGTVHLWVNGRLEEV